MKTKKEEAIRKSYGEYWEQLSPQAKKCALEHNGYISPIISGIGNIPREFVTFNDLGFRPRTIVGIEHNNGWTRIDSEEDLPNHKVWLTDGNRIWDGHLFTAFSGQRMNTLATHYQPIVKPKPPIY